MIGLHIHLEDENARKVIATKATMSCAYGDYSAKSVMEAGFRMLVIVVTAMS